MQRGSERNGSKRRGSQHSGSERRGSKRSGSKTASTEAVSAEAPVSAEAVSARGREHRGRERSGSGSSFKSLKNRPQNWHSNTNRGDYSIAVFRTVSIYGVAQSGLLAALYRYRYIRDDTCAS